MSARVMKAVVLDESADEALLTVSDGLYKCEAYCQPCSATVTDEVTRPLVAFETTGVERQPTDRSIGFAKGVPPFGCVVCGHVANRSMELVRVGEIEIELDAPLPGDLQAGDVVSFACSRLDFVG